MTGRTFTLSALVALTQAKAIITNHCPHDVYLWSVPQVGSSFVNNLPLKSGARYEEPWRRGTDTTPGIAIKISPNPNGINDGSDEVDFAYSIEKSGSSKVWVDLSPVRGKAFDNNLAFYTCHGPYQTPDVPTRPCDVTDEIELVLCDTGRTSAAKDPLPFDKIEECIDPSKASALPTSNPPDCHSDCDDEPGGHQPGYYPSPQPPSKPQYPAPQPTSVYYSPHVMPTSKPQYPTPQPTSQGYSPPPACTSAPHCPPMKPTSAGPYSPPEHTSGDYYPAPPMPTSEGHCPPPKPTWGESYPPEHTCGYPATPMYPDWSSKPTAGYYPSPEYPDGDFPPAPTDGHYPPPKYPELPSRPTEGPYPPQYPEGHYPSPKPTGGYYPPPKPEWPSKPTEGPYPPPKYPDGHHPPSPIEGQYPPKYPDGHHPPPKPTGGYYPSSKYPGWPSKPTGGYYPSPNHPEGHYPPPKPSEGYYPSPEYPHGHYSPLPTTGPYPPKYPDGHYPPSPSKGHYPPPEYPADDYSPPKPTGYYSPPKTEGYDAPSKPTNGGYSPPKPTGYYPPPKPMECYPPPKPEGHDVTVKPTDGGYSPPKPTGYYPPPKPTGYYSPPKPVDGDYSPPKYPAGYYPSPHDPYYPPPDCDTDGPHYPAPTYVTDYPAPSPTWYVPQQPYYSPPKASGYAPLSPGQYAAPPKPTYKARQADDSNHCLSRIVYPGRRAALVRSANNPSIQARPRTTIPLSTVLQLEAAKHASDAQTANTRATSSTLCDLYHRWIGSDEPCDEDTMKVTIKGVYPHLCEPVYKTYLHENFQTSCEAAQRTIKKVFPEVDEAATRRITLSAPRRAIKEKQQDHDAICRTPICQAFRWGEESCDEFEHDAKTLSELIDIPVDFTSDSDVCDEFQDSDNKTRSGGSIRRDDGKLCLVPYCDTLNLSDDECVDIEHLVQDIFSDAELEIETDCDTLHIARNATYRPILAAFLSTRIPSIKRAAVNKCVLPYCEDETKLFCDQFADDMEANAALFGLDLNFTSDEEVCANVSDLRAHNTTNSTNAIKKVAPELL